LDNNIPDMNNDEIFTDAMVDRLNIIRTHMGHPLIPYHRFTITGQDGPIEVKKIGGGTFGAIFSSTAAGPISVYKRVRNFPRRHPEQFHRELFLEAYVQTLLGKDPIYGQNIAALEGIYKDPGNPRDALRVTRVPLRANETRNAPIPKPPAARPLTIETYFYKMENIATDLDRYITANMQAAEPQTPIYNMFIEIARILDYFMQYYGFYHRDLHGGNIMFGTAGNIKLIDFGKACMQIGGTIYSVDPEPTCTSSDLFILCTWLYEQQRLWSPARPNPEMHRLLFSDGGFNIYDKMDEAIPRDPITLRKIGAIFHLAYPYEYADASRDGNAPWNIATKTRFSTYILPKFEPTNFRKIWNMIVSRGVGSVTSLSELKVVPERNIIQALVCKVGNLSTCEQFTVAGLGAAVIVGAAAYGPSLVSRMFGRGRSRRRRKTKRKVRSNK
jgi:serine/threonine protein kinase